MKFKIAKFIHWMGFFASCFMLTLAALDQSKDEIVIHLVASSIPLLIAILINYIITKKFKVLPLGI
jgi:hypothetical protein